MKSNPSKKKTEKPLRTTPIGTASGPREGAGFPIVGIGASAGGLAAFEAFFSGMPADSEPGMAFVLVQHLAPDHKSMLRELIGRHTRMKVFEVEDGMKVQPNCAYIIPPGFDMAFVDGSLRLLEPSAPRGQRLPIDHFFRSLAQDQGERSIGIVLSGTASDGTLGVRAIKGEGGMVMAQTPDSTEFGGMPANAIATRLVDFVLSPQEMPAALIKYAGRAFGAPSYTEETRPPGTENTLRKMFVLLRARSGHDFSQYKRNSVMRRIERRMAINQTDSIDHYFECLQKNDVELDALFRDLLIGVTRFFRDEEPFRTLEDTVIPRLIAARVDTGVVRVWSLGCSTGEEAYSVAILLHEAIERENKSVKVQVFATDIDHDAIATARSGVYPASIADDISQERLSRFFAADPADSQHAPHSYRINKNIRDTLIFSEQDVIRDPPLSKMDLIICRNLMIYLTGDLQKKLIPLFHYALNPGGFLFLGTSESVGDFDNLFSTIDRKSKLYERKEPTLHGQAVALGSFLPPMNSNLPASPERKAPARKPSVRELAEQTLLQQVAPTSALVDGQGNMLYLHGRAGKYLEPTSGEVGPHNILKMAREGLQPDLKVALHKAARGNEVVHSRGLSVKTNDHFTPVNVSVWPVEAQSDDSPLFLVVLEEGKPEAQYPPPVGDGTESSELVHETLIASLQTELRAKDDYLRTANEELETTNANLMSSVEEMQSMNEELQSTNEELETSKEELQSVNEELATINVELQTKLADLSRANNDMNNLLAGTGIATVFLGPQLRILRFTPTASKLVNLIPGDVGRPFTHILTNLVGYDHMMGDVQEVLTTLIPKESEVQTREGNWFTVRILPYRTTDNVIEGAVINFVDITDRRAAEQETKKQLAEKETLLQEVHHRIKNNIASIGGLLSAQADSVTAPEALSVLQDALARINSMSVLYDNLLIRDEYEASSTKQYIERLIDSVIAVFPTNRQITVTKKIADFLLDPARLFPLGIIVNELLTNIIKYAFTGKKAGSVTVSLKRKEDHVTLSIQDDGIGFPVGYDIQTSSGFGLSLVRMLSEQLHGHFSIGSDNGATSILKFDL